MCERCYNLLRKTIKKCPHIEKPYFKIGMCEKCYKNNLNSQKKVTLCPHMEKAHFAKGKCQACYSREREKDRKAIKHVKIRP
jgi:hypothetical protein